MLAQAHQIGPTNPAHTATVTLYLNPRAPLPSAHEIGARALDARAYVSRDAFADTYGAHPDHLAAVEKFAADNGLAVVSSDPARGSVQLSGTMEALQRAFEVELHDMEADDYRYREASRPAELPEALKPLVSGVFGLSTQPIARPRARAGAMLEESPTPVVPLESTGATRALSSQVAMTPLQIAKLYNFPTEFTGAGQTIALIELGGGYTDSNLAAYFSSLGVSPAPKVKWVSVDGGQNRTGSAADGEVQLDIEVAGAVAPGADIVVYFAPNTDQGFIDAVSQALHDKTNNPTIISISWGSAEPGWTHDSMTVMDNVFQSAAALGVSIFVAAGDNGSADSTKTANVDFPASSPNCTACGGTSLVGSGAAISSETVWNDKNGSATGGGVSAVFAPPPAYQHDLRIPAAPSTRAPGRGVPDIAGNADPNTGYIVLISGQRQVYGGTSAVAPLWAGLTALLNQALGTPLGFLNPVLYGKVAAAKALHDITKGNNITDRSTKHWPAAVGWDPCTGLGSPDGAAILKALKG